MANATAGKFWLLDTAGVVTRDPVFIKDISVTWKVGSAGTVEMTNFSEAGAGSTFLYAATAAATSAATNELTQVFTLKDWVYGLSLKTIADVAKLIVHVG